MSARAHVPPADDLAHCRQRIAANFSNYSAWHERTRLLPLVAGAAAGGTTGGGSDGEGEGEAAAGAGRPRPLPLSSLAAELDLVRSAVFTEPDDQSAWFYRRWLVGEAVRALRSAAAPAAANDGGPAADAAGIASLLLDDVAQLRELAALSPTYKWPRVAIAQTLGALASEAAAVAAVVGDAAAMDAPAMRAEARALYAALAVADASHAAYYAYAAAQLPA